MTTCGTEYAIASFRDIEFEILPVEYSGGRRIVTTQYPFFDKHYNEDLGAVAQKWTVKGCFYGPEFRDSLTTAKRIWERPGAGIFFEPTENKVHNVTLVDWSYSFDDKKFQYVEFNLNFVEASEDPYPSNLSRLGANVNASQIVDEYLTTIRGAYRTAMSVIDRFNDVVDGTAAARSFIDNAGRMLLSPLAYLAARTEALLGKTSRSADVNFDATESIFNVAIEAGAPPAYFRRATEARITDAPLVEAQVAMSAEVALGYYFESLVTAGTNFADLAEFVDRATAVKRLDPSVTNAVDSLIAALGSVAVDECTNVGESGANALVASYQLFGNVSRAREIVRLSNGVSGAKLGTLVHRCDVL